MSKLTQTPRGNILAFLAKRADSDELARVADELKDSPIADILRSMMPEGAQQAPQFGSSS